MNKSTWNNQSKPRYHLTAPANETNGSWWDGAPREGFTASAESQVPRFRNSRFGATNAILVEGARQPSAQELMRERKRKDGLGDYAAWQKAAGL
jgi:hypothetical protein